MREKRVKFLKVGSQYVPARVLYLNQVFAMNQNENDYVSLVRIPRKWFNIFVWTFSGLIVANTLAELLTDWAWKGLGETTLARMAVLMTLIVGWFFVLSHIWEIIMLGYAKLFRDRIRAEGKAEGRAEVYREVSEWNTRRLEAEARNQPFNEPPPIPPEQSPK